MNMVQGNEAYREVEQCQWAPSEEELRWYCKASCEREVGMDCDFAGDRVGPLEEPGWDLCKSL
jgi:hypothetical protein